MKRNKAISKKLMMLFNPKLFLIAINDILSGYPYSGRHLCFLNTTNIQGTLRKYYHLYIYKEAFRDTWGTTKSFYRKDFYYRTLVFL